MPELCYYLFPLASSFQCYGKNSGMQKKLFTAGFAMTSFIEIAQIFTGRTTDIDDIITNIAGTLIGYLIAYWYTGVFTRRIVKKFKKRNDFLHNMCICNIYNVLPSTVYFIFYYGKWFCKFHFIKKRPDKLSYTYPGIFRFKVEIILLFFRKIDILCFTRKI